MFNNSKAKNLNLAAVYHQAEKLYNHIPSVKKRKKRAKFYKFLKYFLLFFLILLLAGIIISANKFYSLRIIYHNSLIGKNALEAAVHYAKNKEFQQSYNYAKQSEKRFVAANQEAKKWQSDYFLTKSKFLSDQLSDVIYLISTAEILSRAVSQGVALGLEQEAILSKKGTFTALTQEEKRSILKVIHEKVPEMNGLRANLDLAVITLENIKYRGILLPFKHKITNLKNQLQEAEEMLDQAIPIAQIIPAIAGYPYKSAYLVILQNNDELRPTGGFIGTYGIAEIKDGDFLRLDTHDIYHMDMPVKDFLSVEPPKPLKKYLNIDKWFMRDANWSPDWPEAAEKIIWFYKEEDRRLPEKNQINNFDGEDFDGVIGLTPDFITDLLKITGPIYLAGEEFNSENFTRLLQYKVEREYIQEGIPSWERKEVIGEILKELKIKLLDLPLEELREVINTLNNNLISKSIIIYFKDDFLQQTVKDQGWAGHIYEVEKDYFMVVDANLAAFKTDAVMDKKISYRVREELDGLYSDLTIIYSHKGDFDWRTTRYRTYTRVYVPEGSRLIKADGFQKDSQEIGLEYGKTAFKGFIEVEPGEIGLINLTYKLPDRIADNLLSSGYELFCQKQPGNNVGSLTIDLNFAKAIKSYKPTGFYVYREKEKKIRWEGGFYSDQKYIVNFNQ